MLSVGRRHVRAAVIRATLVERWAAGDDLEEAVRATVQETGAPEIQVRHHAELMEANDER